MSTEFLPAGARPLTARGGIRAQTKSRKVGKNWWTKRWMSVLENFYMGAELPRGRAYAQAGQVLEIDVAEGEVRALVQGSTKTPYRLTIKFKPTPAKQWDKLATALSGKAIYVAKLLSGQMPESIEETFSSVGLSLFPKNIKDLETECSCGNGSSPCKHVIAVYYLLAEMFDRDPFLFMRLRGLDRRKLIESIGSSQKTTKGASAKKKADYLIGEIEAPPGSLIPTLSDVPEIFWHGTPRTIDDNLLGDVRIPPTAGALAKHLGHFPMWRGEERFLDALDLVYKKAAQNGMNVFLGDW